MIRVYVGHHPHEAQLPDAPCTTCSNGPQCGHGKGNNGNSEPAHRETRMAYLNVIRLVMARPVSVGEVRPAPRNLSRRLCRQDRHARGVAVRPSRAAGNGGERHRWTVIPGRPKGPSPEPRHLLRPDAIHPLLQRGAGRDCGGPPDRLSADRKSPVSSNPPITGESLRGAQRRGNPGPRLLPSGTRRWQARK